MPSEDGISILMVVNNDIDLELVMEGISESLDRIIPEDISYNILGII